MTDTTTISDFGGLYDPDDLLTDANARTSTDLTGLESVKDLGVLQPVVALRTADGRLRVRFGHRRVLAARHYGKQVPVWVAGEEGSAKADQVARLIEQWAENEDRAGFTDQDKAGIMDTLFDLDVSEAQVAKRLHVDRATVKAAARVRKSGLAKDALARYDHMTLDQAATFAEFEDDNEALETLAATSKDRPGQFDHVAQELRDNREERAQRAAAAAELDAAGVAVVSDRDMSYSNYLSALADGDGNPLTPEGHAACPGHAAVLLHRYEWREDDPGNEELRWVPGYVCTDPVAHGHQARYGTYSGVSGNRKGPMTDEQKAERRRVVDGNRKWRSATEVRRNWLRTFLAAKTPRKGTVRYVITALATDPGWHLSQAMTRGHGLACDLLSLDGGGTGRDQLAGALERASDSRAQVIALGIVLAAQEAGTSEQTWQQCAPDRNSGAGSRFPGWWREPAASAYLRALVGWGYTLSPIESTVAHPGTPLGEEVPDDTPRLEDTDG